MTCRFADFVFDGGARQLRQGTRVVDLTPKAFDLLGLLLAARPRVLARSHLHDRLWPNTFIAATSLPRLVTELRKALGDTPRESHFIRTVHGHGYAFCGDAGEEGRSRPPVYALLWAGREIPLLEGENLIGRGEECALQCRSARVSRRHASLRLEGGRLTLEDLGSRNGTFVNGRRLERVTTLNSGDVLGIGSDDILVLGPPGQATTEGSEGP